MLGPQPGQRPRARGLDRTDGDAEVLGDLGLGAVVEVAQDHDAPLPWGEFGQQPRHLIAVVDPAFGIDRIRQFEPLDVGGSAARRCRSMFRLTRMRRA